MAANRNHPPKGSRITVDPIKDPRQLAASKRLLADRPRDRLLFTLGINNGRRVSDLLALKVGQLRNLEPGKPLFISERKTGKRNVLMLNRSSHKALRAYLEQANPADEDYLFRSAKGPNRPLTVATVNQMIKAWCRAGHLPGHYGTHSLRKTFGYMQRVPYGVGWEVLCRRFNHSSPRITMRYLGIGDEEVNGILRNEI